MYEFAMTEPRALKLRGAAGSRYAARRLRRLAALAARLADAGWAAHLCLTGLAFSPPGVRPGDWDDVDVDLAERRVREMLAGIGVREPIRPSAGRTLDEVSDGMAWWLWCGD